MVAQRLCTLRHGAVIVDYQSSLPSTRGRQLDTATSTIEALPDVVEAVAGRVEVYLDGCSTSCRTRPRTLLVCWVTPTSPRSSGVASCCRMRVGGRRYGKSSLLPTEQDHLSIDRSAEKRK
ncbi:MAG: alpha-hydroxy-acid oxidizing protein [Rhodococcus sp. (in: high G+C Gram-positive bacteria)]|uniref:alpha-hydroxy-acid oxidizing protein n=1 Tax=Rhodococcus sp. TaxID=1831 RepID=UPI003BB0FEE3